MGLQLDCIDLTMSLALYKKLFLHFMEPNSLMPSAREEMRRTADDPEISRFIELINKLDSPPEASLEFGLNPKNIDLPGLAARIQENEQKNDPRFKCALYPEKDVICFKLTSREDAKKLATIIGYEHKFLPTEKEFIFYLEESEYIKSDNPELKAILDKGSKEPAFVCLTSDRSTANKILQKYTHLENPTMMKENISDLFKGVKIYLSKSDLTNMVEKSTLFLSADKGKEKKYTT
jgi:hypothetical protein